MERRLSLEPLGWPEHAPASWRQLARTAAQTVGAGVLDGRLRYPVAPDEPAAVLGTVAACRGADVLVHFVDAAPDGWISDRDRRTVDSLVITAGEIDLSTFLDATHPEMSIADTEFRPLATAALLTLRARLALRDEATYPIPSELVQRLVSFSDCLERLGGDPAQLGRVHPAVVFHVARSLWLAEYTYAKPDEIAAARGKLADVTRAFSEQLVARVTLGQRSPGESVALAFCAASAPLVGIRESWFVYSALKAATSVQSEQGIWSEGTTATPTLNPDGGGELPISTHEVAWVVAESLLGTSGAHGSIRGDHLPSELLNALVISGEHARHSVVDLGEGTDPKSGWPTVHRYGERRIELLPTAMVLMLAVSLRRLRDLSEHRAALREFEVQDPEDEFWPEWLKWDKYKESSEPDAAVGILGYIDRELVAHARQAEEQPPWRRVEGKAALLFGPPGTTKTTIVRAVAQGAGWPLVTLSPGDFIERGLEMVEAQATLVFDRLHALVRAVVLFDECDELFRERHPEAPTDQTRGIAAFITASMLPKLQDLHDRGQILLFVLTNHFATMDPAVKRLGRMDHLIGVGPPDEAQRLATIRTEVDLSDHRVALAADSLASHCENFNRSEVVRAAQALKPYAEENDDAQFASDREAISWAKQEYERLKDSGAITANDMESFRLQASQYSGPHIQAAGRA